MAACPCPSFSRIVTLEEPSLNPKVVAQLIDHTLLKPEAAHKDIVQLCREAREFGFASVCVNPYWVSIAAAELFSSAVHVCTVVGFPLGANQRETKVRETELALTNGATEIDMVQNIGALKSGDLDTVHNEIADVAELAHSRDAILKIILETSLLTSEEIVSTCQTAIEAQADFVKTSTGFSKGGATAENVRLMRSVVGPKLGVKASGGIRTLETLRSMVEAGATRIGTSSGIAILGELATTAASELTAQGNVSGY